MTARNSASKRHLRGFLDRFRCDCRASAAVEMALVFPIFGYIALNLMDVCMYMYSRMQTESAAEAAVGAVRSLCDTAAKLPATNPAGHCSATLATQMNAAAQTTGLGARVTLGPPSEGYYCADAGGTLRLVAAVTATPPGNCSATVTGSTSAPGNYIAVTASFTYTPFAPGLTIMSALSTSIQQTAWMRLQ